MRCFVFECEETQTRRPAGFCLQLRSFASPRQTVFYLCSFSCYVNCCYCSSVQNKNLSCFHCNLRLHGRRAHQQFIIASCWSYHRFFCGRKEIMTFAAIQNAMFHVYARRFFNGNEQDDFYNIIIFHQSLNAIPFYSKDI